MKRFFSYNDQNEFELHDTLAEAKAAAEKAFEYCSDEARSEGWSESVDEICYGELRGHVVESLREPWDTNKHGAAPEEGCDHVEYTLQDAKADILELHAENLRLRNIARSIAYPQRGTPEEGYGLMDFAKLLQSAYTADQLWVEPEDR